MPIFGRWTGRPRGFWPTAGDYLAHNPDSGNRLEIEPAGVGERVIPVSIDPELARTFAEFRKIKWTSSVALHLRSVRVLGVNGGAVIGRDGRLIGTLSPDPWSPANHAAFARMGFSRPERLSGRTAMLGTPQAPGNYGHWLYDLLRRLLTIERAGFEIKGIDHFLINMGTGRFCRETLEMFAVPMERVVPLQLSDIFDCDEIVTMPMLGRHWQHHLPPHIVPALAARLRGKLPAVSGRLWLSRRGASVRRLLNEDELLPILRRFGFRSVELDQMPVAEQAALFAGADAVAGPHGSAFANLMFCQPGTRVLEIHSPSYWDMSFWTLASYARLTYHVAAGEGPRAWSQPIRNARSIDFSIDPGKLCAALERLLDTA